MPIDVAQGYGPLTVSVVLGKECLGVLAVPSTVPLSWLAAN